MEEAGSFLIDYGFENYESYKFVASLDRERMEGCDPDQLIVDISANAIQIWGDFASYRGRNSFRSVV